MAQGLVVADGVLRRRALIGGKLGAHAARNGWAGVVIDACVRDVGELGQCAVGIRAGPDADADANAALHAGAKTSCGANSGRLGTSR